MRLFTPPWKTAWYDDNMSEKFFQEIARTETLASKELETSAKWMEQMIIEFGQLAQNMIQLEKNSPATAQIRMAFEKAIKVSALAAHLAAALDRADPDVQHTPVGRPDGKIGASVPFRSGQGNTSPAKDIVGRANSEVSLPPKQTIINLSRRGLSVAEIEMATGESKGDIETVLRHPSS